MAGILNKKTRFIDLVVTQEGKRQIASGKLRAEYASLTDSSVAYESKMTTEDVRKKIYFEVMERPENVIVLEKDDSGKLIDFDYSPTGSIVGENIFNKPEDTIESDLHKMKMSTGSQFASLSEELPKIFLRHFRSNQFIGSHQSNENKNFELNKNEIKFAISNSVPFPVGPKKEICNVDAAEPFLLDRKLTHLPNFTYMPPVNVDGTSYGNYTDLRNMTRESWEDIKRDLGFKHFEEIDDFIDENSDLRVDKHGDFRVLNRKKLKPVETELVKEYEVIRFKNTSDDNNIIMQIFETDTGRNKIKKLDIVDAGVFYDEDDVNLKHEKQVFYVGKIYLDNNNTPTFINIFTIIMD